MWTSVDPREPTALFTFLTEPFAACFARLRDDWFLGHGVSRTLLRTETSISSQIAGLPPSRSSDGSTTLEPE
jgi:hypothetical protein